MVWQGRMGLGGIYFPFDPAYSSLLRGTQCGGRSASAPLAQASGQYCSHATHQLPLVIFNSLNIALKANAVLGAQNLIIWPTPPRSSGKQLLGVRAYISVLGPKKWGGCAFLSRVACVAWCQALQISFPHPLWGPVVGHPAQWAGAACLCR